MSVQLMQHRYSGYLLFDGIFPEEVELIIIKMMRKMLNEYCYSDAHNTKFRATFLIHSQSVDNIYKKNNEPFLFTVFNEIELYSKQGRCKCGYEICCRYKTRLEHYPIDFKKNYTPSIDNNCFYNLCLYGEGYTDSETDSDTDSDTDYDTDYDTE